MGDVGVRGRAGAQVGPGGASLALVEGRLVGLT